MARRTNPQMETGDYSYSKPTTEHLNMLEIFGSLNKKSVPSPVVANPTTWIKTPPSSPNREPFKSSSPEPKTPNHSPPKTPPPPPFPNHLAQAVHIVRMVVDEVNVENEQPLSQEAIIEVEKLQQEAIEVYKGAEVANSKKVNEASAAEKIIGNNNCDSVAPTIDEVLVAKTKLTWNGLLSNPRG